MPGDDAPPAPDEAAPIAPDEAFLTTHDRNPFRRTGDAALGEIMDYEEVVTVDPFEARFTFTAKATRSR